MPIVKGGHAIMLSVTVPPAVAAAANAWVDQDPKHRASRVDADPHMTLLFVGRDVDSAHHDALQRGAAWVAGQVRAAKLLGLGVFQMFGGKHDTLAMPLIAAPWLVTLRTKLQQTLKHHGVPIANDFKFNPHVTLAIGQPGHRAMIGTYPGTVFPVTGVELKLGSGPDAIRKVAVP